MERQDLSAQPMWRDKQLAFELKLFLNASCRRNTDQMSACLQALDLWLAAAGMLQQPPPADHRCWRKRLQGWMLLANSPASAHSGASSQGLAATGMTPRLFPAEADKETTSRA